MKLFVRAALCAFLLLVAGSLGDAYAQDAGQVRQIVVEGVQRIEPATVRSYMAISEGDPFDPQRLDKSLKSLFATGLFADVTLRREGDTLIVAVVENPIINRIAFEGNQRINDDTLQSEVQLRPRVVFTRTKVQADVQRVLDLYRRQGRFAATVDPKVIQLEQNRVDLVFEINEGPSTNVRKINFVGNKQFSDSRLREELATREERWYRFFSTDDTYDPDRLNFDRELLRRHYLNNGYADFRVVSAVAELSPDRESFFITFTLEEGERYKFGQLGIETTLPELNAEDLRPQLTTEQGDWYDAEEVENSVQRLTSAVGDRGYAFVDVRPDIRRDRENRTIDITYRIDEGPRVFVERIDIGGNVRTLDKVIRREFRLAEGDAFNAAKLRRSQQRIRDLNFFEKVEVDSVPSETAPDRTVVKVDVEEKSTGELSFGVGWSSAIGALGEVSMRERNLLGRGQDLRLSASLAQRRNQIDVSFTEPYFLDRPIAAGFDVFVVERELQRESSYDFNSAGGALRVGYQLSEALRQDLRYGLRRDKVDNVASNASRYVREQEGETTASTISQNLTYDQRDSRIEPTEGYVLRFGNDLAGLGGDQRFLRTNVGAGYYWPLAEQVVLSARGNAGYIFGIGRRLPITEHFFLGGDDLRGFASAGVSPRDPATTDALGGKWMYHGSVEARFPLGLPQELGFSGKLFSDFGSIGNTDLSVGSEVRHKSSIRLSVGTGVTWRSPMGPISVDLGFPILKEAFDEKEAVRINFGTRF